MATSTTSDAVALGTGGRSSSTFELGNALVAAGYPRTRRHSIHWATGQPIALDDEVT